MILSSSLPKFEAANKILHSQDPEIFTRGVPAIICKAAVYVNGKAQFMTEDEEDALAEGRNYEHSNASIHATKLQLLLTVYSHWCKIRANLIANTPGGKVGLSLLVC